MSKSEPQLDRLKDEAAGDGETRSQRVASAADEPTLEGAFADDGVDLTLIRWMLERTPTERLQVAQDLIDAAWSLRSE